MRTLTWSQEQAETKQAELIGMSTAMERDQVTFSLSRPTARQRIHSASSRKQTSAYEVETQGDVVVSAAAFKMPLTEDS